MKQANDFLEETAVLYDLVKNLDETDFDRETLFKQWRINDILVHLHFWNIHADLSLNDPARFENSMSDFLTAVQTGKLRDYENKIITQRGHELLSLWFELSKKLAGDFAGADPKKRVKWAGPEMSAKTCISARQMEVWAHGQAIFDLLGKDRTEADRIRNIVFLGVNAFGWSHHVHGLPVPETMPQVKLVSPSGEVWNFGEESSTGLIKGPAVEFAQVVTQTRNIADTTLEVSGKSAESWMLHAQCFAGPAENPPSPGERRKS